MRAGKAQPTDSETAFLAAYDPRAFEPLAVAVDVVLLSTHAKALHTLLVRRAGHPFKGGHALPGGFVGKDESLDIAAARVCKAKVGIADVYLEQLYTFGAAERDPRMRVVSVAYYALIEHPRFVALADRGPAVVASVRVPWKGETGGAATVQDEAGRSLTLAFDHTEILGLAIKRLRGKLSYVPLGLALLGETFTLLELQQVHEAVLGRALNKDAFRRKVIASGWIRPTGKAQSGVVHRPAELYAASAEAREMLARR
jgi:8-oxo-dGTP diphosphatase